MSPGSIFVVWRRALSALALGILATGCAVPSVQPGASREEVVSRLGTPSRVVALAAGTEAERVDGASLAVSLDDLAYLWSCHRASFLWRSYRAGLVRGFSSGRNPRKWALPAQPRAVARAA